MKGIKEEEIIQTVREMEWWSNGIMELLEWWNVELRKLIE
jgi:hypothetical protein